MGCLEDKLRQALHQDACRCLEALLNDPAVRVPDDATRPGESCHARRVNTVESVFGPLVLRRNYYARRDEEAGGRAPLDTSLGIVEGCTPGLARLMCRAGALEPYEEASQSLAEYCGLQMEGRRIQRLIQRLGPEFAKWTERQGAPAVAAGTTFYVQADGTGVPVRREETVGREGKGEDGQARTREIKVGVVFWQGPPETPAPTPAVPAPRKPAFPARGERVAGSTRYVTSTDTASEFGVELRRLAFRQGMGLAGLVVFLGDGAPWVWELARTCFPFAKLILDFYHAAEHVGLLTETLFGKDTPRAKARREAWVDILKDRPEGVDVLIRRAQAAMPHHGKRRRLATKALTYFENNRDKMRYWEYQSQGLFIGSGVVEAGCRTVVGQRLKQSGMFWGLPGAHNILDIRCVLENAQFDQFWKERALSPHPLAQAA
jgi:hypothetical protein